MQQTDVFIIGAGPAGTLAAAMLQQKGWKVEIAEKQQFPRFVIGESLLPRVMDNLEKAGLLDTIKAQNFQIKRGARFAHKGQLCEFDFSEQYAKGWSWTWQVPRSDFDKALADEVAQRQGVAITYRESVEAVDFEGEGVLVSLRRDNGETRQVRARFLIDASGYGRVLPRLLDLDTPSDFPVRMAFFTHFKDVYRPQDQSAMQIMVVLHENVWIWVIPFSNGNTSVGFVAEPEELERFEGASIEEKFRNIVASKPELRERFGAEVQMVFEPQIIRGYSAKIKKMYGEKFVLAGNATEFLDPVLSSGVMFAIESGTLAGELTHKHLSGEKVDWENDYTARIQRGIEVFRTYVLSWYNGDLPTIFFSKNPDPTIKKYICSVLAGYVWDETNPFVMRHKKSIKALAEIIRNNEKLDFVSA